MLLPATACANNINSFVSLHQSLLASILLLLLGFRAVVSSVSISNDSLVH